MLRAERKRKARIFSFVDWSNLKGLRKIQILNNRRKHNIKHFNKFHNWPTKMMMVIYQTEKLHEELEGFLDMRNHKIEVFFFVIYWHLTVVFRNQALQTDYINKATNMTRYWFNQISSIINWANSSGKGFY